MMKNDEVAALARGRRFRPIPNLRRVRFLGGFTGAWLVADPEGALYVSKTGAEPGHVREEILADEVYRILGVPVPDGELHEEGGRVAKVSAFVGGTCLQELVFGGHLQAARDAAFHLRRGFAADALLANWDVVGVAFGNPVIGEGGVVYRVDNGSALRRRARGGMKPTGAFSGKVRELDTLRDPRVNRSAAWVYSGFSDGEIAR